MNIVSTLFFICSLFSVFFLHAMNYNMEFTQDRPFVDGLPPLPSQYYIPVYPTLHHSHAPKSCVNTDQDEEVARIPKKKCRTRCGR